MPYDAFEMSSTFDFYREEEPVTKHLYRITNVLHVISEFIDFITYSTLDQILVVHFKNGTTAAYLDVPHVEYDDLDIVARRGQSVGSHYNNAIKGSFATARTDDLDYQHVSFEPGPRFQEGDFVRDSIFGTLALVTETRKGGTEIRVRRNGSAPSLTWLTTDAWELAT